MLAKSRRPSVRRMAEALNNEAEADLRNRVKCRQILAWYSAGLGWDDDIITKHLSEAMARARRLRAAEINRLAGREFK
jgi:hypothetical protein